MKHLFKLLLISIGLLGIVLYSCSKEENNDDTNGDTDIPVKNCMMSQIVFLSESICDDDDNPDQGSTMYTSSLSYDDNDRLTSWEWADPDMNSYYFEYNEAGKLSKVMRQREDLSSYAILEWDYNKVSRQFFYDDEPSSQKFVFEFGSDEKEERVSIYTKFENAWVKTSYYEFYWKNSNVDKVERYRYSEEVSDFELIRTFRFDYDDKYNPFALQEAFKIGIWESAEDNAFLYSKNNVLVTTVISSSGSEHKFYYDYEYNDSGFISKWSISQDMDSGCTFVQTQDITYKNCN